MGVAGITMAKRATRAKERTVFLRKAIRKEKLREKQRPKMGRVDRKGSRRATCRAKMVGSRMFQGKERVASQMLPAIDVANTGILLVIAGELQCDRYRMKAQNSVQQSPQSQQTSVAAGTPSSQTSSQMPVAPQQGRIARIQFADDHASDVLKHDELVFDLRSPCSASSCLEGNVRTLQFFIGDEPNAVEFDVETVDTGLAVRTMLEDVDDVTQMHSILLDSGADASVFPISMAELGSPCNDVHTVLRDAQGQAIPLHGFRDVELHLMDMKGRAIVLRETVALSDRISQPILCFGHLLENGWSVNGVEQTLTHGSGISIPIELQNKSMLVRGWVRMMKDEPQVLEPFSIRAVRAELFEELSYMRVGWNLSPEGVGSGKHYGNCFQDPTLACPTMSGRKFRTTLIKDGDQWLVMELCEPLETLIDLAAGAFLRADKTFSLVY